MIITSSDDIRKAIYALASAHARTRDKARQLALEIIIADLEEILAAEKKGGRK